VELNYFFDSSQLHQLLSFTDKQGSSPLPSLIVMTPPPNTATDDGENRAPGKSTSLKYTYKDGKLIGEIRLRLESMIYFYLFNVYRSMESC
jgi:hypothetical protein